MKAIIILGDGMADLPIAELGGKTPLMAARKPNMDSLASLGRTGMYKTVPDDMPPGSEVANLAVLGYDVRAVYQGRGVLEGAAMGVEIRPDDLAMRCNLVCLQDGRIKNHSAGHIGTEEARELIAALNAELGDDRISFHPGVSYRHLLLLHSGSPAIRLTPPHDVPGALFREVLPQATSPEGRETAELLTGLILRSQAVLADHPVNLRRAADGKDPGNSVWFWSAGRKPDMKSFQQLYGKSGAVISAVDLLHGIGVYAGFRIIHVEGATGLWDTNYEGKAAAALAALQEVDVVYLHIEAADEAGHEGNCRLKIRCIEDLDSRVVGPIMAATLDRGADIAIALLPDHPTPCSVRTHTHDPVPFAICKPGSEPDSVSRYDEVACAEGAYGMFHGDDFMKELLR